MRIKTFLLIAVALLLIDFVVYSMHPWIAFPKPGYGSDLEGLASHQVEMGYRFETAYGSVLCAPVEYGGAFVTVGVPATAEAAWWPVHFLLGPKAVLYKYAIYAVMDDDGVCGSW